MVVRNSAARAAGLLVALALVAAACGGNDDGPSDPEAAGPRDTAVEEEGEPQYGGRLVYAREAETSEPWTPQQALGDLSGLLVMRAVYDPLAVIDEDLQPAPYLAESITPNEDFTEWTIVTREGIEFHDGTPFDSAAVVANLERAKQEILTSRVFKDVESFTAVDERTVRVALTSPWATFDLALAGQTGFMASPVWLAGVDAGSASALEPVGTGPFVYESYQVGADFVAERNENYWREDEDGNQLPYLDAVEFRVLVDSNARTNAVTAGDVDVMHQLISEEILRLRDSVDAGELEMIEGEAFGETRFILMNLGKQDSPVRDPQVRRAMALAIDRKELTELVGGGVNAVANGPWAPGSDWYEEDSGYPEFDQEEAIRLVDEYEAENGDIQITLGTTSDPTRLRPTERVQRYLEEAGIEADIEQVEQGQIILNAAFGRYETYNWRGFSGANPESSYVFQHSDSSAPVEQLALNFGRVEDPAIDEVLDRMHTTADDAERAEAAKEFARLYNENLYALWLFHIVTGVAADPAVNGVGAATTPDGDPQIGVVAGLHSLEQVWMEDAG